MRYAGDSVGNVGGTVGAGTGTSAGYTLHTFSTVGSANFNLSGVDLSSRLATTLTEGIQGTGNFTYSGPGLLVLSADSTYVGNTTISAGGTLQVGSGGTTGSLGTGSITNNGTLAFSRSNSYTVPGAISGTGTVAQYGPGDLDLGGLSHNAGAWTLSGGSISNGTMASGNFTLERGLVSAVMAGTGTLTKTTDETATITGTNTYSGTTSVNAGTLLVNGDNSSATGAVTVASGGTLGGTGTVGGAVTAQTGGTLSAGDGVGTLTTSGNVTLNAGSNLNWQITDATGGAGTGWDMLSIGGVLDIAATSGSPVQVNVWSVLAGGADGAIANFEPTLNTYTWKIATAAGGISGFAANKFQVNTSPTNGTGGLIASSSIDGFTVVQNGNDLELVYSPPVAQTLDGVAAGAVPTGFTTNTSAGSLTLNLGLFAEYLVVAGGGGGGGDNGGGGGAGGVRTNVGGTRLQ